MTAAAAGAADAIVIGAGVIGSACAFRIAERGLRVAILEAAPQPAAGSTGRSAAGVRVQFTTEVNVRLSWESILEYRAFSEVVGADAEYRPVGYLFLVPHELWDAHSRGVELQRAIGAPVEVLSLDEAAALVPFARHGLAGATFGPIDGIVDPHRITLGYLGKARELGARLHLDSEVLSARRSAGTWRIDTKRGRFEAPAVVNAAGPWAGVVAQRAGLEVPVVPVRRMVFMSSPLPGPHRYPLTIDLATGFYFRSEGRRLLMGRSNPEEPPGFAEGMDWSWLEPTLEAGLGRFPWLEGLSLDRRASWWGYYEVTPDHNPILGRMPNAEGWLNACGFSGHGVQQAAAVGRVIAEELLLGRPRLLDIDALRWERFLGSGAPSERHIV